MRTWGQDQAFFSNCIILLQLHASCQNVNGIKMQSVSYYCLCLTPASLIAIFLLAQETLSFASHPPRTCEAMHTFHLSHLCRWISEQARWDCKHQTCLTVYNLTPPSWVRLNCLFCVLAVLAALAALADPG